MAAVISPMRQPNPPNHPKDQAEHAEHKGDEEVAFARGLATGGFGLGLCLGFGSRRLRLGFGARFWIPSVRHEGRFLAT